MGEETNRKTNAQPKMGIMPRIFDDHLHSVLSVSGDAPAKSVWGVGKTWRSSERYLVVDIVN